MSAAFCAGCGTLKDLAAKGLCSNCYRHYRSGALFTTLGSNIPPGRRRWSAFEDALLSNLWGTEKPVTIWRRINLLAGNNRSLVAVLVHASQMGLDYRTSHGQFTVDEVAAVLGVGRWHLDRLVRRKVITPAGNGKCLLISAEDFDRVMEVYPPAPDNAITKTVAMQRLGYSETHITRLLQAGAIRGVRRGERWHVDADHVAELVAEMKASGATRKDWGPLPHLEAERAKCREYAKGRRREARQEARKGVWYTQTDAARTLGVRRDEMRRLLQTGKVRGKQENYLWLAERAHVDALAALG